MLRICVIGVGPRGLGVLERILAAARQPRHAGRTVAIDLVDPACDGTGVHATTQPDHLLLNIICGQVSLFPDRRSVRFAAPTEGPDLHEWALQRDLRMRDDYAFGATGRMITPEDFLPRRVLGEYLSWCLNTLIAGAPPNVRINRHRDHVDAIRLVAGRPVMTLRQGSRLEADYAFLTIGQGDPDRQLTVPEPQGCLIRYPYPLPAAVDQVGPGETLAVEGLGLSAVDVILACTVGRGGRFEGSGTARRYLPSGREPTLIAYSRSGAPLRSRPRPGPAHRPVVFTTEAIDAVRKRRGGRLGYERDVLPLLLLEMRIAFHLTRTRTADGSQAEETMRAALQQAHAQERAADVLDELDARTEAFDATAAYHGPWWAVPMPDGRHLFDDASQYQQACVGYLEDDLRRARVGIGRDPVKSALEVCREQRDVIRHAVDFAGLGVRDHVTFFRRHSPLIDRAVVGPQQERTTDLLALLRQGTLALPLGPGPRVRQLADSGRWRLESTSLRVPSRVDADWRCLAHVRGEQMPSPLLYSLVRSGLFRAAGLRGVNESAPDLTEQLHPIDQHGDAVQSIFVLGPLAEGVTYYNNYVTSPGKYSKAMHDADRSVEECFSHGGSRPGR